ncbi:MAG: CDP-diacylglycerol--glycerol-3-phosphate 3-phosphatidyltransferase [Pirellulaceae bacterium]|nr:CDP-diacylglycerol--glycerol-3-phosphate 3-phosphatidyltransferase [Pirellulaceae bacterium]
MAESASEIRNVPNFLSLCRFLLAILLFFLISFEAYSLSVWIFIVAASTDWVDGWWARKYDQVTQLGRMFDPFVDKIIICGAFIMLASVPNSGIVGWMAVLIVGRELLVTALRSYLEAQGADFSANFAGKLKMVFQCIAVVASLLALVAISQEEPLTIWFSWFLFGSVWVALLSTVQSGLGYLIAAAKIIFK